jgi:hypothetical protein
MTIENTDARAFIVALLASDPEQAAEKLVSVCGDESARNLCAELGRILQDGGKVSTIYMDVNPDIAVKWLEGNVMNRPVSQSHVEAMAEEMKAGRWITTHQGIAFDDKDTLVDGQQRLWAIFLSGRTIRMSVTRGLSAEAIELIDGGKGRSMTDRMCINGRFGTERVNRRHAATLHEMVQGLNSARRLTYQEEVGLMTQHVEAVRYANSRLATRTRSVSIACVRAVIARAWYSVDREKLGRFCRVLSTGMGESANDDIVLELRTRLMMLPSDQNAAIRRESYGMVESVLATWLKGEPQSALRSAERELFPLPEDAPAQEQARLSA